MRGLWRILRWSIIAMVTVVVTGVSTVFVISRTEQAHEYVRTWIVDLLTRTYRGRVEIGSIHGSFLGDLEIHNIVVSENGAPAITIPIARVRYALFPLISGWIRLSEVELVRPQVRLARSGTGEWNIESALTARNSLPPPHPKSSSGYRVSIHLLKMSEADIEVDEPERKCRLTNTNLSATANIEPATIGLLVQSLDSQIKYGNLPVLSLHAEGDVHQIEQGGSAKLSAFSLKTQSSQIDGSATLFDVTKLRGEGEVQIRKLAASDLNAFYPRLGIARDVAGSIKFNGEASMGRASAILTAGGARTIVEATTNANGASYDYQASIGVSGLNLSDLFRPKDNPLPNGTINCAIKAKGSGTDLTRLSAQADLKGEGLAFERWRLGNLVLSAQLEKQIAAVDAKLANGSSHAHLNARIDLQRKASYQLALTADRVDLRSFVARPNTMPPSNLNAKATLRGTGVDPHLADAEGAIQWSRSNVGAFQIDRGEVNARLTAGLLHIRQASIQANDSILKAQGTVAVSQTRPTSLSYSLHAGSLAPWLALTGHHGSGSLDLAGTIAGNYLQLRTRGTGEGSALKFNSYSAGHIRVVYDVTRPSPRNGIQGQIELTAAEVDAATKFRSLTTNIYLRNGPPQVADVSLTAIDEASRSDRMDARLTYAPGDLQVNLADLSLTTGAGVWRLAHAAELRIQNRALHVHNFEFANGGQSLSIEGGASATGEQNLRASVNRVSVAALSAMLPQPPPVDGLLSAQVRLSGDAGVPVIDSTATIDNLNIGGRPYRGLEAKVAYAGKRASVDIALRQDDIHSLRANGTIPLRLAWSQQFQAESAGDMDMRITSPGIDIVFLSAFTAGAVKKLQGTVAVDIVARGPLNNPLPEGYMALSGAKFLIKPLNVNVTDVTARIEFDPRQIRVANLQVTAGDGSISGSGSIELDRYSPRQLNIVLAFNRWPAIATHEYQSIIGGSAQCSGPLDAPKVSGSLEVLSSVLRPDISLFEQQSLKPDETIHVSNDESKTGIEHSGATPSANGNHSPLDNVAVDLTITIDRNNWIKIEEGQIELEGRIHVKRQRNAPVDLTGKVRTVRGYVSLVNKRFDIVRGEVTFVGGAQIDPLLDVVGQQRVQNYVVSANVTGSASKPNLTLSSVPSLEQPDILSMIMFGRPVSQLNGGQQQDLKNQTLGMAASRAGRAIADALGLGDMGITTTETGGVGLGRYVTEKIYVSASQETIDQRNRKGTISYHLTPEININTSTSTGYGNQIELQWRKDY